MRRRKTSYPNPTQPNPTQPNLARADMNRHLVLLIFSVAIAPVYAEPLKATISRSDQVEMPAWRQGEKFDPSKIPQSQDFWVLTPDWMAGQWVTTSANLVDRANQGHERDNAGRVWHCVKLPAVSEYYEYGLPVVKITHEWRTEEADPGSFCASAKTTIIRLDANRRVTLTYPADTTTKFIPVSQNCFRSSTRSNNGFETVVDYQRIAPFMPAGYLRASLDRFLAAHPELASEGPAVQAADSQPADQGIQP